MIARWLISLLSNSCCVCSYVYSVYTHCFVKNVILRFWNININFSCIIVGQKTYWEINMFFEFFFLYFADRASQYIYFNINQLDALNFIMSLFHASTYFEHKCSSSGGQNCTIQSLVSSHSVGGRPVHRLRYQRLYSTILASWRWALVLETCRGMK